MSRGLGECRAIHTAHLARLCFGREVGSDSTLVPVAMVSIDASQ